MKEFDSFLHLLKNRILKLDKAELDFGIYKLFKARREAIVEFLDHALRDYVRARMAALPGGAPTDGEEARIYGFLDEFFNRYYDDGDFVLRARRGRDAAYSLPYRGEDVVFHWATRGSHYVKSGEHLRALSWHPAGGGEVRFEVVAADLERDNVKGAKRYFVPRAAQLDGAAARFEFDYRPLTADEARRYDKKKRGTLEDDAADDDEAGDQDAAAAAPTEGALAGVPLAASKAQQAILRAWLDGRDFAAAAVPATLAGAPFEANLARFVRRQTSDFFVHPNLGPFLERELDYALKDRFMQIWDRPDGAALARERDKLAIVRDVGRKIVAFLHRIEDFQARLFEKRKLVLRCDWLAVASDLAARPGGAALIERAAANEAQVAEWAHWVGESFSPLPPGEGPGVREAGRALLARYPQLPIHTLHFDADFKDALLACYDDIEAALAGTLIHGENYAALRTLEPAYRESVQCIHIDPPYNTDTSGFLYANEFRHASWLSMMLERLANAFDFLPARGALLCHIDENEYERLHLAIEALGTDAGTVVWDKRNPLPTGKGVARQHEYVLWRTVGEGPITWSSGNAGVILDRAASIVRAHGGVTERARREFAAWVVAHPGLSGGERAYRYLDDKGAVYQSVSLRAPEPRTDPKFFEPLPHPRTGKPCAVPPNGFSRTPETLRRMVQDGEILFGEDETSQPRQKLVLKRGTERQFPSVIDDARTGRADLAPLGLEFPYCHPVSLYGQLVSAAAKANDRVLDFFAGSGTTAHAVLNLNREDGGARQFILVEQGEYFDTVIVPRVAKLLACPEWKDGKPKPGVAMQPAPGAEDEHWSRRTLPLVKIVALERYEDSLDALDADERNPARQEGLRALWGDADYLARYGVVDEAAPLFKSQWLARPFDLRLAGAGPQGRGGRPVDLAHTALAWLGLRLVRWRRLARDGAPLLLAEGRTRDGKTQLVVLRDAPAPESLAAEYRWLAAQVPAALGRALADYDRVWVNGDAVFLGGERGASLDPEMARAAAERDPHAAAV